MACCCGNPCPDLQKCGTECCAEDHTCCNGATCCAPGQTCCEAQCCNGDQVCCEGSCCAPNQYCCGDACCDNTNESCCDDRCCSFTDCYWSEDKYEFQSIPTDTLCGASTTVAQFLYNNLGRGGTWSLPSQVSWQANYPGLFGPCPWVVVYDVSVVDCAYPTEDALGYGCAQVCKTRIRVLKADCFNTITDVTNVALTGTLTSEGVLCGTQTPWTCSNPATPVYASFFPDPEFFCPP